MPTISQSKWNQLIEDVSRRGFDVTLSFESLNLRYTVEIIHRGLNQVRSFQIDQIQLERAINPDGMLAYTVHRLIRDIEDTKMGQPVVVKKKRVVEKKGAPINPAKVKAPDCAIHHVPMEYDPTELKWRCPQYDECGMVARPKRDADDRNVILGKGSTHLRLVEHQGKLKVLVMSDDNVAVDITIFCDPIRIARVCKKEIENAVDNGHNEALVEFDDLVALSLRFDKVYVMGTSNILELV